MQSVALVGDKNRPCTAPSSGFAARPDGVTTHALLDNPLYGPTGPSVPSGTVVGFGVGDVCGERRAGGAMNFACGGEGTCHEAPDDRYHESLYAPTFGVPTGPFIEAQLFLWLDVRVPRIDPFGA